MVDDIPSSLMSGTSLSNALEQIETAKVSEISLKYLDKKCFITLMRLAFGIINFQEYEVLAKREQLARIQEVERVKNEELEKQQRIQDALNREYHLKQKAAIERKREEKKRKMEAKMRQQELEKDPAYMREVNIKLLREKKEKKLKKLRVKYELDFYIEISDLNRLAPILERVDSGGRVNPEDMIWLSLNRNGLYRGYYTDKLKKAYHKNESAFYAQQYEVKQDPWLAVNASSHYRKCDESPKAISILSQISLDEIKNKKLKSAICTTHGGAERDMKKWTNAIRLAQDAHAYTPDNFRPCTLLGAIYMETGAYTLGQEWYDKAVGLGFSEKSVDDEIKVIYKRADKSHKESLRNHLLKSDPYRYSWVNDIR